MTKTPRDHGNAASEFDVEARYQSRTCYLYNGFGEFVETPDKGSVLPGAEMLVALSRAGPRLSTLALHSLRGRVTPVNTVPRGAARSKGEQRLVYYTKKEGFGMGKVENFDDGKYPLPKEMRGLFVTTYPSLIAISKKIDIHHYSHPRCGEHGAASTSY